jgi:hypothetical protein
LPPLDSADTTDRLRPWVPVPQVTLHADHADHPDCRQSAGHAWVLQDRASLVEPHALPPLCAATLMRRARVWAPVPQVTEHAPYADHADSAQSTGQAWALHTRCSSSGHSAPPNDATTTISCARDWTPPPQVREQVVHANHLGWQSTGHGCVLQSRSWVTTPSPPSHALPPAEAGVVIVRVRDWVPLPQSSEHAPYPPHALTTQSTGHANALQALVAARAGQATPP